MSPRALIKRGKYVLCCLLSTSSGPPAESLGFSVYEEKHFNPMIYGPQSN